MASKPINCLLIDNLTISTPALVNSKRELDKVASVTQEDWRVLNSIETTRPLPNRFIIRRLHGSLEHRIKCKEVATKDNNSIENMRVILAKYKKVTVRAKNTVPKQETTSQAKEVVKVPIRTKDYIPYKLATEFKYVREVPYIIPERISQPQLQRQVFLHFDKEDNKKVKVDEFVKDIEEEFTPKEQCASIKRGYVEPPKELIMVVSKVYGFGDEGPRDIKLEEYTDNFACYKLNPLTVIEFLKQHLSDREITLKDVKELMIFMGAEVSIDNNMKKRIGKRIYGEISEMNIDHRKELAQFYKDDKGQIYRNGAKISKEEYEKWVLYGIGYGEQKKNEVNYRGYGKEYLREDKKFEGKEYVKKGEVIRINAMQNKKFDKVLSDDIDTSKKDNNSKRDIKNEYNVKDNDVKKDVIRGEEKNAYEVLKAVKRIGSDGVKYIEKVIKEYDETTGTYKERVIREVIEESQDNKYIDSKITNELEHNTNDKDDNIINSMQQDNKVFDKDNENVKNKKVISETDEKIQLIYKNTVDSKEEYKQDNKVKENVTKTQLIKTLPNVLEEKNKKGKEESLNKAEVSGINKKEAKKDTEANKKKILTRIKGKIQKKKVEYKDKDQPKQDNADLQEEVKTEKVLQEDNSNISEQDSLKEDSNLSSKESEGKRSHFEERLNEIESKEQEAIQANIGEKPTEDIPEEVKQQVITTFDSEGNLIENPTSNEEVEKLSKDIKERIVEEDKKVEKDKKVVKQVVEFEDNTDEEKESVEYPNNRLEPESRFKGEDKLQKSNFSFKERVGSLSKKRYTINVSDKRDMKKKSSKKLFKHRLVDDELNKEQKFLDDLYKKVLEEAQQEEEEKERLKEEARKAEEENKRLKEEEKKKKEESTEGNLREQEDGRKLEILLERISRDYDLRSFLLQLSEEELGKIGDIGLVMDDFFSEEAYPEFYKSKLKDSRFTPFLDLSELNLKRMMEASADSKTGVQVGSEVDWKIFRALYNKMKLLGKNNNALSDGVICNKKLNQEYEPDNFSSSEELLANDIDLFLSYRDQSMDIEKKIELLKEQLYAIKTLMEKRKKKELDINTTRRIINKATVERTKLSLPNIEKKYKVDVPLINRRSDMHEIEILERRYQIINP